MDKNLIFFNTNKNNNDTDSTYAMVGDRQKSMVWHSIEIASWACTNPCSMQSNKQESKPN